MGIRLLPATIGLALLLFAVKAADVWRESSGLFSGASNGFLAEIAVVTPAIAQQTPAPAAPAPEAAPARAATTAGELEIQNYLRARREELDEREREIDLRANLLAVTERRVEERIAELKKVEETIRGLLAQHDEQQEQQMAAVVKIYEAMKPKDAANIFNRLQMPVLIEIADRMKERVVAPILAEMDPAIANALTTQLATRRSLPQFGGN